MVDSDDEIIPDPAIVEILIADSNAELITFNYEEVWSDHTSLQYKYLKRALSYRDRISRNSCRGILSME